jgi:hypothetical protein
MSQDITDLIDGLSDAGRAEAAAIARRLALIGELDALAATVCANDPRDHDRRDRITAERRHPQHRTTTPTPSLAHHPKPTTTLPKPQQPRDVSHRTG